MKIIENGVARDMTPKEIEELESFPGEEQENKSLMSQVRAKRAGLFYEADIEVFKGEDNGLDVSAWRTYRQKLRDITKNDPKNIVWPDKPAKI